MGRAVLLASLLAAALAAPTAAQLPDSQPVGTTASLTGTVTDAAGAPLPGAHVYLAGTMRGTATGPEGTFRLDAVPLGAHRVVATMLGYALASEDVVLRRPGEHRLAFALGEAVLELGEARVEGAADRRWQRRLARFQRELVGESTLADSVRLLNPEVLEFSDRWGTLRAEAAEPLIIENRALGYRIRYALTVFEASATRVRYDGEPLFEELAPRDAAEAARWREGRARAYAGSLRHFLRALLADRLEAEGFHARHHPGRGPRPQGVAGLPADAWGAPVSARTLLRPGMYPGERSLRFPGAVSIVYERQPEDEGWARWHWNPDRNARPRPEQRSEIFLNTPRVTLDARGEPDDPFAIVKTGYLAFRRLAMLLPVEYGLPEE